MVAAGSNSPHQLREGKLRHQQNSNLIDNAAVRLIGNSGEKKKKKEKLTNNASSVLMAIGEWWRRDLYSPCELRIWRDGDCPNQNLMVVSYHQVVVVALKMRREHFTHTWHTT